MTVESRNSLLVPCPFCDCGHTLIEGAPGEGYQVACAVCDATGPLEDSEAEALEAWNTRPME